jgi:hypothetical protein
MSQSSARHLIDVQFEDSQGGDAQMAVDTSSTNELFVVSVAFLGLVGLSVVIAAVSPPSKQIHSLYIPLRLDVLRGVKYATFLVSALNEYLSFSVVPSFTDPTTVLTVDVSVEAELSDNAQQTEFFALHFRGVLFAASNRSDQMFPIFWRRLGVFRRLVARVSFRGNSVGRVIGCLSEWSSADTTFAFLESAYRYSFLGLVALVGLAFYYKVSSAPFRRWFAEQKMTAILVAVAALAIDPLRNLFVNLSTTRYLIVHELFQSAFTAFLRFYILAIFDLLAWRNLGTRPSDIPRKAEFGVLYCAAHFAHQILPSSMSGVRLKRLPPFDLILTINRVGFDVAFFVWLGWTVNRCWRRISTTDVITFATYSVIGGFVLVESLITDTLGNVVPFLTTSCVSFVLKISVENFFVILMMMMHWPYQTTSNKYVEPGHAKADIDVDILYERAGSESQ